MKAFLFGILFLVLLGVGGFIGLKYFYTPDAGSDVYKTAAITKSGVLKKSTIAKSDFTHVLVAAGQSTGVASYTLNLDDYAEKTVEVTGQFSGTTLYADTIKVIE